MLDRSSPAFYHDLHCDSHKMEMSSLAYCCVHSCLSNVHDMCQKCLFSSNDGKHHSLNRDLSIDFGQINILEVPLLREDVDSLHAIPLSRTCSCCSEPLKQAKAEVFRLVHDTNERGGIGLIDDTKTGTIHEVKLEKDADHLPHVEYSELKTEDSNSELHTNDLNDFDVSHKREEGTEDSLLEPFLDGKEMEQHVISTYTSTYENPLDELHNVEPDENTEKHLSREVPCEEQIGTDMDIATEKGIDTFYHYLFKFIYL
jgi:hypothetical protein